MTRSNVYAGPAGFWILRDPGATGGETGSDVYGHGLPAPAPVAGDDRRGPTNLAEQPTAAPGRSKYREIPIAIQDRSFNADGSLFYPDNRAFFEGLPPAQLQIPFVGDCHELPPTSPPSGTRRPSSTPWW